MDLGILFLGVLAQIIGAFIAKDKMMYAGSLWLGVLLALAATYHMYRSLAGRWISRRRLHRR